MNNKKIFSVKMFWQSFLQLKVIGFISTILIVLITCVPICISAVNIKSNIEYAGVEKASRYVQLVDGNDFIHVGFDKSRWHTERTTGEDAGCKIGIG